MKLSSGTLALVGFALCLPVHAQDTASSLPSAAQPASVAATSTSTVGLSDIRIVRLSQVRGKVDIDRHIGRGYEEAFANVPITGGTKLHTDVGLAEVEFEDNSSLRLTPDTEVEFTQLKRSATGSTISSMKVVRGMVYASLANTKGNIFTITAGETAVQLEPSAHIRLSVDSSNSNLSVLDGTVEFTAGTSMTVLKRKESLDFDLIGYKPSKPAKLEESAFDQWDKNGVDYQKQYSALRTSGGSMSLYGSSDLNYYGSFVNMPGCGSMWRPYFASAAWSPYDNGMWAYYPSVGYSWVSPYPWGWLPFHSGNWVNCGGAGWGWQPGGGFVGLQNVAYGGGVNMTPAGGGASLRRNGMPSAPLPPRAGAPAMVPVNTRPLSVSSVSAPGTFTFRKDSAGLGVPRDFGELRHMSSDVAHHGQANTEIERSVIGPSPAFANRNANGNPNLSGVRGSYGREVSPGSRGVATFSRPNTGMRENGMDSMNGMNRPNNGMNGMNNGVGQENQSAGPRGSWQRPEGGGSAGAPMQRNMEAPRANAAPPSSGGSSQPSAGASRK
ncbi:MAG TPA: FecR family protein [Acidobacteriaceae bacterium]|nr:FecR family protein [Acidobacteriaceae bacterium]